MSPWGPSLSLYTSEGDLKARGLIKEEGLLTKTNVKDVHDSFSVKHNFIPHHIKINKHACLAR